MGVETVLEDMVNAVTGAMGITIQSAASDYSVDMVCTVTVDMVMATITEAVLVDIILLMVISMGDMVVLKDILSHTRNIKRMANLKPIASPKHMLNLQPIINLQLTINLQPILNLKLIPNQRPILKRIHQWHLPI